MTVNLNTHSMRYSWNGVRGIAKEIPRVAIKDHEPIPPLNKVRTVWVNLIDRDVPSESSLGLRWMTDKGVHLVLFCRADDQRLKEQYSFCPNEAKKVVGLLREAAVSSDLSMEKWFSVGGVVSLEEVPEKLKAPVGQLATWKDFVERHKMSVSSGSEPYVTGDGEYYVFTLWWNWVVGPVRNYPNAEFSEEDVYSAQRFDPGGKQPMVVDGGVYWELPAEKVVIMLPHRATTDEVAAHFGYSEALDAYRKEVAAEREREKQRDRRMEIKQEAEAGRVNDQLAEALLGKPK